MTEEEGHLARTTLLLNPLVMTSGRTRRRSPHSNLRRTGTTTGREMATPGKEMATPGKGMDTQGIERITRETETIIQETERTIRETGMLPQIALKTILM